MAYRYDVLLKNGLVVDYLTDRAERADLGIQDGKIVEIAPELSAGAAKEILDASGMTVMPGVVDLHVHASAWLGGKYAHKMMASRGVTTALDMSGPIRSVLDIARDYGAGMNLAAIEYVRPGDTVRDQNPGSQELKELLDKTLAQGALGFKLLGGHYPLTVEATRRAIETVNRAQGYIAFHAGSLENGSNLNGFLEAVRLAGGMPIHIAHANSYCRGAVKDAEEEMRDVADALIANPNIRTEAYLSPYNGTSAKCSEGLPESMVTRKCLATGGFAATQEGMEQAILAGWANVNVEAGGQMALQSGSEAVKYWRDKATDTTVSFSVNPPGPRIHLAMAKRPSGDFVVDAISTDGGGIPRNVIIEMGLSLVKLQALSLKDFVRKASYNPAQILGLKNKGHLSVGADADITVLNLRRQTAEFSLVGGKLIMYKGYVLGRGTNFITTEMGKAHVTSKGLKAIVVDLTSGMFYQKRK